MKYRVQLIGHMLASSWRELTFSLAAFAGLLMLSACEPQSDTFTDACGYDWKKTEPASAYVTVIEVENSFQMPAGNCRDDITTLGCHIRSELAPGRYSSTIWIDKNRAFTAPMGCDTLVHEFNHAAGYTHQKRGK